MSKLSSKEQNIAASHELDILVDEQTLALSFTKLRTKLRKMRGGSDCEDDYHYTNYLLRQLYAYYYSFQPSELNSKRVRNEMYKDFEEITDINELKTAREMYNELQRLYLSFGPDNGDFHTYYMTNRKVK